MKLSTAMILAALALAAAPGAAQAADAPPLPFASSAEVLALVAKAKAAIKPNQPLVVQPLLSFAPYAANLEYRREVGVSAIHEIDDEMFYVIEGSGTLQTGGQLVNARRVGAHDVNGAALAGAVARKVAKGDFFVVPEGVPHWFSAIDGALVMMSLHIPGGSRAAAP